MDTSVPSLSLISADLLRKIMGFDLKTILKKYFEISDNFSQFFLSLDIDNVKSVWSILAFSVLQQFLLVFHLSFKNIARLTSSKLSCSR